MSKTIIRLSIVITLLAICASPVLIAAEKGKAKEESPLGYKDTPMLPGDKWHIHDIDRPQPRVVTPGTASTDEQAGTAPSDAIVLFDGKDLSKWRDGKGQPSDWLVENGVMVVPLRKGPKAPRINIYSRDEFGDAQVHVEWCAPPPQGDSQHRSNSGVFLMDKYEFQILDSYQNRTYADGHLGAIYGQFPPFVNACRPPGKWQTYDIIFTAPQFSADGKLEKPAYATVLINGVLVQNHAALLGPAQHRKLAQYAPHPPKGPLVLQDHGNPMRFRNIWVRELKGCDQP